MWSDVQQGRFIQLLPCNEYKNTTNVLIQIKVTVGQLFINILLSITVRINCYESVFMIQINFKCTNVNILHILIFRLKKVPSFFFRLDVEMPHILLLTLFYLAFPGKSSSFFYLSSSFSSSRIWIKHVVLLTGWIIWAKQG